MKKVDTTCFCCIVFVTVCHLFSHFQLKLEIFITVFSKPNYYFERVLCVREWLPVLLRPLPCIVFQVLGALDNLTWLSLACSMGAETGWSLTSFPIKNILWFCDWFYDSQNLGNSHLSKRSVLSQIKQGKSNCQWFVGWFSSVLWLMGCGDSQKHKLGKGRQVGLKQNSSNDLRGKTNLLNKI